MNNEEEMDIDAVTDRDMPRNITPRTLDTFFSSGDRHYPSRFEVYLHVRCYLHHKILTLLCVQNIDDKLRDSLMTAVKVLQEESVVRSYLFT